MKVINGQYRMTVKDLRAALEGEPDDAIVVVDATGSHRSIYKTACAADESILFLYSGGAWPSEPPNV